MVMSDGRFAGVDWASEEHAACVVDERGRILEGRRYRHNEPGIRALCARLVRLAVALVALERPDGLLIERLLDAGLSVVAVHPNQVKASRPRYSVAGGKSDSFDSFVLAELARTDSHRFRVLVPDSDRTKALRAMTRARESLVRTRVGLANQLSERMSRTVWNFGGGPG
jgi:transposase